MEKLLQFRRSLKSKKPNFVRQSSHKKKRLASGWRRPKGSDSKVKVRLKGYVRRVSNGFRSPQKVRGLDRSGLAPVLVHNVKDVSALDKKMHGVVIASTVGNRKREQVIEACIKTNITILNIKDPKAYLARFEDKKRSQAEKKKSLDEKKEKKSKDEKAESALESKVELDEDKKEREKREKEKLLIKKTK